MGWIDMWIAIAFAQLHSSTLFSLTFHLFSTVDSFSLWDSPLPVLASTSLLSSARTQRINLNLKNNIGSQKSNSNARSTGEGGVVSGRWPLAMATGYVTKMKGKMGAKTTNGEAQGRIGDEGEKREQVVVVVLDGWIVQCYDANLRWVTGWQFTSFAKHKNLQLFRSYFAVISQLFRCT